VSLGWAYRSYIDGGYMRAGLTRASARDGAQRMLANYQKASAATRALNGTFWIRSDQP